MKFILKNVKSSSHSNLKKFKIGKAIYHFKISELHFSMMRSLPFDTSIRCLVFGKADSGKTRFIYYYATKLLTDNEGVCLIITRKTKAERKLVLNDNDSCLDRILYKWVTELVSLINVASSLHLFTDQNLQLLVIEDLLELIPVSQVNFVVSLFLNALTVFPQCRFIVTITPRKEFYIGMLRLYMTHYVNTLDDTYRIGLFPTNIKKAKIAINETHNSQI